MLGVTGIPLTIKGNIRQQVVCLCGDDLKAYLGSSRVISCTGMFVGIGLFKGLRPVVSYHGLEMNVLVCIITRNLYYRGHPYGWARKWS